MQVWVLFKLYYIELCNMTSIFSITPWLSLGTWFILLLLLFGQAPKDLIFYLYTVVPIYFDTSLYWSEII